MANVLPSSTEMSATSASYPSQLENKDLSTAEERKLVAEEEELEVFPTIVQKGIASSHPLCS